MVYCCVLKCTRHFQTWTNSEVILSCTCHFSFLKAGTTQAAKQHHVVGCCGRRYGPEIFHKDDCLDDSNHLEVFNNTAGSRTVKPNLWKCHWKNRMLWAFLSPKVSRNMSVTINESWVRFQMAVWNCLMVSTWNGHILSLHVYWVTLFLLLFSSSRNV